MNKTYRVGFEDPAIHAQCQSGMPGWIPVVELGGAFAFGEIIALCPTKEHAQNIVDSLMGQ